VHNINLVTPDMYIPQIIPAIIKAKENNIGLPFIMNCSGYETVEMIKSLDGLIDIYLPDFKYMSSLLAKKYSNAIDYPNVAKNSLKEMVRQQNHCVFNDDGLMISGVIVRHMLIPGNIYDSKRIIKYLYDNYKDNIYISIMSQYTPVINSTYSELNKKVTKSEYDELIGFSVECGITNAFIQDEESADEDFIPNFFIH
jgi:putative pyruvate formate lyase activating enzyme